ncbi:4-carboxymuconolactone decarboxylase [Komarekiella sp. 'clone 1']|uniref:4-carboxymuconolactone decarboxylase n=1 Tax=Komarekiella delphini-convector SJRDD-AB1 TaxID=2593771 RepID=A0AA40T0R9_9NOST|nr:carboxymuconolactone decarboxylase family protein [Komarekiella delphini-convector]MBD6618773.1 4-carboxymuconolactone decarboxylase [Komarekiella delphini-convector SJRDD-AB1]
MKKLTVFLALVSAMIVSLSFVSEAQTMNNEQSLNARQQSIVTIAAFTASGDMENLAPALSGGLNAGLTVNEIKEVLVQLYAYAGFPRSLNALNAYMSVLKERQARGIKDVVGREASPLPTNKSLIELGTEIQTRLIKGPVTGEVYTFAPVIDQFLKSHLFGDIFGRDTLDFQSREIATIAALASLKGVNAQLRSHFRVGMNTGLTEAQMNSLVSVLKSKVGKLEADNAAEVLNKVLSNQ